MNSLKLSELSDDMLNRAQVYSVLSRLFIREVDEELLSALQKEPPFSTDTEELAEGAQLMQHYLESDEASTLDLARDYAKGFCGASSTQKTSAFPFESVYTSDAGILMQEARDDMLRWYRKYGLNKDESFHDCEDHIGLELEFFAYLISEFVAAIQAGDDDRAISLLRDQGAFMHEHLINWIPEFAHHIKMRTRTDFYQGLGIFLLAFIRQDCRDLDDLIAQLPPNPRDSEDADSKNDADNTDSAKITGDKGTAKSTGAKDAHEEAA